VKEDKKTGVVPAKGEFKLVAEEKLGAHDALKIKATVKETSGDNPAASDGFVWIDKKDGSMLKTEVKWTNAPVPGVGFPVAATVKIELKGL